MTESIVVSVVVCTFNRAAFLRKCLASLLHQENPPPFEIIVVDNNSTDETVNIVEAARQETTIPFQYIFLQEMGLSRARNAGIHAARGALVAFLDDDAIADAQWVQEIEKGFQLFPQAVGAGGAVAGDYEIPKPAWLPADLLFAVSVSAMGNESRLMEAHEAALGCNMAFRRETFCERGDFLTNLGRTGLSLLAGEEVEFCFRLYKQSDSILYNPHMRIKHWVPKERLTKTYIRQRMFWNGRSIARADQERGNSILVHAAARFFGAIPFAALGRLLVVGQPAPSFFYDCMIAKHWGYIREALALSRLDLRQ
jgi:glycosyltransferase involved in cell wall biosynthesis